MTIKFTNLYPQNLAEAYIRHRFTEDGRETLVRHFYGWYEWDGARYQLLDPEVLESGIRSFLCAALAKPPKGRYRPFPVTSGLVAETAKAMLREERYFAKDNPQWISGGDNDPHVVPTRSGLVDLRNGRLWPPNPDYFSTYCLPEYNPDAKPLHWFKFLLTVWPDDSQSIKALQCLFGVLISADTRWNKIYFFQGPRRSGKGTIAHVVENLLGSDSVCSSSISSLDKSYPFDNWLGKRAAIFPDERFGHKVDVAYATSQLLSVTGGDLIRVTQKHVKSADVRLNAVPLMFSNLGVKFADQSGAFASRLVLFRMVNSFLGREDLGLKDRLTTPNELSGILNWAIQGWQRLQKMKTFPQPASGRQLLEGIRDNMSPIQSFFRERLVEDAGGDMTFKELYTEYCAWSETSGQRPMSRNNLIVTIQSICPKAIRGRIRRTAIGDSRPHGFRGLRFRVPEDEDDAQNQS